MITQLILKLRILPRWVIILIDLSLVAFCTFLGYLLRFNFVVEVIGSYNPIVGILLNTGCVLLAILLTRSYAGIVRYTGLRDGVRLFYTLALSVIMVIGVNMVYNANYQTNLIPYSVLLISFLASFLVLYQYRLLIKNIFSYYRKLTNHKKGVIIFGAGQLGIITQQVIDSTNESELKVVAFVDDDVRKSGKFINGTQIYSGKDLANLIEGTKAHELIISTDKLTIERKNEIVDICLKHDIRVRTVPKAEEWMKGDFSLKQIQEIKIEDLLGRKTIKLENEQVQQQLTGHVVLITGAAGSIGSEIVRQVIQFNPSEVILLDQAESPLYELEMEIASYRSKVNYTCYVADIRNNKRVREIMDEHRPDLIYHAAAYKHVPLMERNPVEAIRCNILGTRNLANAAVDFNVEKFVMISTDKAVNPTNVMGCSKRISEIYVQSLNNYIHRGHGVKTMFVTTRFGNVLGSNGSVIPFFKKQIEKGGPVTVTHPEITRYFMTIPEACQLVLEAGAMGKGGEIFIFDMGRSIKIYDLAKKMIQLSGLELNKDIDIVFTGLREGEKLYEELLANKESTKPTHHEKIMIADVAEYDFKIISSHLEGLEGMLTERNNAFELVKSMKSIVPEFISNSSEFEVLDSK